MADVPHFKPDDDMDARAFDTLIDRLNAIGGLTVKVEGSNDGQPVGRFDKAEGGWALVLYPNKLGGGNGLEIMVCTDDGPALVTVATKGPPVLIDPP
jgi:hypothetical protein